MNALLAHRGPDSQGQFAHNGIAVAVRRLAIIDLRTGDQPVFDASGRIVAILNGEIYNFQDLTQELRGKGYAFRTRSDTEILVHGYHAWGTGVCEKLKGMFAFAIVDTVRNRVVIARDRFGEKPLFYHRNDGGIIFASEIRALLEWTGIERKLDKEAFAYFLRLGFAPSPLTLLSGVRELPPGCVMEWDSGRTTVRRYYEPDYLPDPSLNDYQTAVEAVRSALETAVRRQMMSDVPLGAFLSGGMDSSSVVAMLARFSDKPVRTFTVRFDAEGYDESAIAARVARHLGTEHTEISVANAAFQAGDFWRIIEHVGQPFPDSSAIPTYFISRAVRDQVTVCLTGDGGDEMFAGYPTFRWAQLVDRLGNVPTAVLSAARAAFSAVATLPGFSSSSRLRQGVRAMQAAGNPPDMRLAAVTALFQPSELRELVADPAMREQSCAPVERFARMPEKAAYWTPLRRRMYTHITQSLPQDMLVKIDRMSMACSLELRAPMLDPDLASLTMKLPDSALVLGNVQKRILRDAVRRHLPDAVFEHPKTGFSIPLHHFQNQEFAEIARDLMAKRDGPMALLDQGITKSYVDRGLSRRSDRADYSVYRASHQLWALMQLSGWSTRFGVIL